MKPIEDPKEIQFDFGILSQLLALRNQAEGFNTETGVTRNDVEVGEFMLMCGNETELQFKHRDTRNYVYLRRSIPGDPWKLIVAATGKLFNLGFFDKIEVPVGSDTGKSQTIGKQTSKRYKCEGCGHESMHTTNHYGQFYDRCPRCSCKSPMSPVKAHNCLEPLPEGWEKTPDWKRSASGEVVKRIV